MNTGLASSVMACALLPCFMVAPSAQAYSYSAEWSVYKPRTNTVEFTIKFREPPDFFTTDAAGRAVNEFQYHVWGDKSLPYPDYWDSVIRVEQSYLAQGMLVIRGTEGFHVPDSPVWGAVRGVVPYTLTGTVLTFSVPVPVVSDHGPLFDYNLLLVSYGDFVSQRAGQVSAVPEPGIAALMLGGLALLGWRKKRLFTDSRDEHAVNARERSGRVIVFVRPNQFLNPPLS